MPELLLELFSEEIPARMQARAREDLKRLVTDKLKEAGLAFTGANAYATPRRLALTVDGLPLAQPDVTEEKRGPRVGAPEQAIQGFLKSAGLASLDQCEKRDTGKGEFWFAVVKKKGVKTSELLPEIVYASMWNFPWPKTMRWADEKYRWVRPLHSVIAVFNGSSLKMEQSGQGWDYMLLPDTARVGNTTYGHRFLDPREIKVAGFGDYKVKLREGYVIVDPVERRATIKKQTEKLAAAEGMTVKPDDALLDEVTGLVEWPVALMGRIDERFMDIPPEVLTTSMRVNQKYFSLLDKSGKLAPRFLVVANMETKDGGKAIVAGNERVLRARLADAKFFWDQDRKVKLKERVPALKDIVFHAKLGTVADKVSRMQTLATKLAAYVSCDVEQVKRAALLAKADLTSGMVGEFPELQGVMGRYYAMHEGEKQEVADAIAEHYAPLGPNDRCPTAPVSVTVALADKIDSLAGFFVIGEKPTGSKDPYALRRTGLSIIRLILENRIHLRLREIFVEAVNRIVTELYYESKAKAMQDIESLSDKGVPSNWVEELELKFGGSVKAVSLEDGLLVFPGYADRIRQTAEELLEFLADRLKVALRDRGIRHDMISAVFALGSEDDLVRLLARVDALKSFLATDDGANLLTAYRRANNIVRIEEEKDKTTYRGGVLANQLVENEERNVLKANNEVRSSVVQFVQAADFTAAMTKLATLRQPVDAFFDRVTVNTENSELRANRLRLLSEIRTTLNHVADFSKVEG